MPNAGRSRGAPDSLTPPGPAEQKALNEFSQQFLAEVTAFAFAPVDDLVAVGTSIGQVKLFNTKTGSLVRTLDDSVARRADPDPPASWSEFQRPVGCVSGLAFSPDGKTLVVGGGQFSKFADIPNPITRLGLSDAAPGSARVLLFDVATGRKGLELKGVGGMPSDIAFSPDGKLLACSGNWIDGGPQMSSPGVIFWNPASGERVRSVSTETNGAASHLAFSSDSRRVVVAALQYGEGGEAQTTILRHIQCGTGKLDWSQQFPGHSFGVEFTPQDSHVLKLRTYQVGPD